MMTDTPTPEAIVKAALERAADTLMCNCQGDCEWPEQCPQHDVEEILALASDQAEMAAIVQNARGQTDPYLYAVGYDVGFEDGFKEAQGRIKELERLTRGQAEQLEIQGNNLAKLSSFGHEQADRIEELEMTLAAALEMALTECPFRHGTASYNGWWDDRKILVESLRG